jgi:hypothetical protein
VTAEDVARRQGDAQGSGSLSGGGLKKARELAFKMRLEKKVGSKAATLTVEELCEEWKSKFFPILTYTTKMYNHFVIIQEDAKFRGGGQRV